MKTKSTTQIAKRKAKAMTEEHKQTVTESVLPKLLTRAEAATELRVSMTTLDEVIRQGKIPHIRLCRRVFIPLAQLRRFIETAGSEVA